MECWWPWCSFGAGYSTSFIYIISSPTKKVQLLMSSGQGFKYNFSSLILLLSFQRFILILGKNFVDVVINSVPTICSTCMMAILIPQIYWWTLMLKGCFKFINRRNAQKSDWMFLCKMIDPTSIGNFYFIFLSESKIHFSPISIITSTVRGGGSW